MQSYVTSHDRVTRFTPPRSNASSNKRSSSRSVHLVVPVLGSNNNTVVANVVALVANDENLGGGNGAKSLVTVSIAECYNGGDTGGGCG